MDHNNALGLTVRLVPDMLDHSDSVDWDSVTVVSMQSMQSIPDQGQKSGFFHTRLFAGGRWRSARAGARSVPLAWCQVGLRLRTGIKNIGRQLPALLHALSSTFTGCDPRAHVVPHPIYPVSVSTYQCAACQSSIAPFQEEAVLVPCGHQYHAQCVVALVESSMQTLASFPPQCCRQTIPTTLFERHLSRAQRAAFAERQSEHITPKRVYCANPHCSCFLGARDKHLPVRVYTCPAPSCGTRTCARCKARVDTPAARHACTHDPGHRATLRLGSRMGWVRCPACEELIERHGGCAHMTCVCGAQFCYRCRALWKSCNCVDWGDGVGADPWEARLFAPLEEGGDLGAQLALYIPVGPPVLERPAEDVREEEESVVGNAQPEVERPQSQSCSMPRAPSCIQHLHQPVVDPRVAAASSIAYAEDSPKVSPVAESPTLIVQIEPETTSCFPFFVDPYLLARGVQAQEIRLRRQVTGF